MRELIFPFWIFSELWVSDGRPFEICVWTLEVIGVRNCVMKREYWMLICKQGFFAIISNDAIWIWSGVRLSGMSYFAKGETFSWLQKKADCRRFGLIYFNPRRNSHPGLISDFPVLGNGPGHTAVPLRPRPEERFRQSETQKRDESPFRSRDQGKCCNSSNLPPLHGEHSTLWDMNCSPARETPVYCYTPNFVKYLKHNSGLRQPSDTSFLIPRIFLVSPFD